MMKHVSILILIFLACLFAGCADEPIDSPEGLPEKGIVVKLTTGQLDTKTHLYSQASLHHVTRIYAILYYCGDMTADDIDTEKTKVVASQLLMKDGAPWDPSKEEGYGQGQPQTETFELLLPQDQIAMVPGKYMILCVGLDDASGDTYGLTYGADAANKQPEFAKPGAKLSEAQAVLAKEAPSEPMPYEKDPTTVETDKKQDKELIAYGHPDIAHSELFAGWQAFDFMPDNLNVVEVELRRRVAGVLCYLSDIPYKLNMGNTPYRVTEVRLNLFQKQNARIGLTREMTREGKPSLQDFGGPVDGKKVCQTLCKFDLKSFKSRPEQTRSGDLLYSIPTGHLEGRKQLENTILMGAYALPIQNNTPDATLNVELWGYKYDDAPGSDDQIVAGSELTRIKSFPAIYEGKESTPEIYSLHPNMIYHIGHKLEGDNTEGDYPESLAGTKVTVEAGPWQEVDIPVEFPSVPIVPLMSLRDKDGNKYKVEPEEAGEKYYIFDCIGSRTNHLEISASILYENWKLTAVPVGDASDTPWIQFWDETTSGYVTELTGTGGKDIYIRMADYASVPDWENKRETRKIRLLLEALEENGSVVSGASSDLYVEQYNALIVTLEDDSDGYRGFSRFDFGTKRNAVTGDIVAAGQTLGWGYWSSLVVTENWADGKANYREFINKTWIDDFKGSAIQVCALGEAGKELEIDYEEAKSEDPFWFLPSIVALRCFLKQYKDNADANIERGKFYWSSNSAGYYKNALATKIDRSGNVDDDYYRENKENAYYARQACHAQ